MGVEPGEFSEGLVTPELHSGYNTGALQWSPCSKGEKFNSSEKMSLDKDILEAREFEDWIVTRAHFNFNMHNMSGSGLDETDAQGAFTQKKKYTIPYRCFLSKKVERLLLAGRNISGTHLAYSNYRVMPICANMGQGTGTAAALSAQEGLLPRELDVKKIQEILLRQGVTV